MAAEVVHDDDVSGLECGNEELLDIGGEELAVDRAVEHAGGIDPVMAQRSQEGQRLPLPEGGLGEEFAPPSGPTPQWCHVGLGPGFIDEDERGGIKPPLILLPLFPPPRDLGPVLFGGEQRFFLKLNPARRS